MLGLLAPTARSGLRPPGLRLAIRVLDDGAPVVGRHLLEETGEEGGLPLLPGTSVDHLDLDRTENRWFHVVGGHAGK